MRPEEHLPSWQCSELVQRIETTFVGIWRLEYFGMRRRARIEYHRTKDRDVFPNDAFREIWPRFPTLEELTIMTTEDGLEYNLYAGIAHGQSRLRKLNLGSILNELHLTVARTWASTS